MTPPAGPPARWYQEPQASANTVYAAFALAFDACTTYTAAGAPFVARDLEDSRGIA